MLLNKDSECDTHCLQRSKNSKAADFCREKEIYSSQLNKEIRDEAQISLPEQKLGVNFKSKVSNNVVYKNVRRGYTYLLIIIQGVRLDSLETKSSKIWDIEGATENKGIPLWWGLIY